MTTPTPRLRRVRRLILVTPFERGVGELTVEEQLVILKGCALCQITRQLDANSTRNKPEWKQCKAEMGVPIDVHTVDVAEPVVLQAIHRSAPAVCAESEDRRVYLVLDKLALAQCNGSVRDFRGRLKFRLATLGLELPNVEF
jgi:hypothetical protein